ncbi:Uncharacterised protein [uncultured archaeon]|nr:Uncharacterised protein [uncultured archaeon]
MENAKCEHQVKLIGRLRQLAGNVPVVYDSQHEFFLVTIRSMSENLMDLKRETLKEACDRFGAELDKGKVTDKLVADFKDLLDKLVSEKDFAFIDRSMVGSAGLIKSRLSALQPLSVMEEERKKEGRDPTADRLVTGAYKQLQFKELESELMAFPNDPTIDKMLTKARENVAEYCCLYNVPLRDDDTLSPFSLSRIDAVVGACHRLSIRIWSILETYR